MLDLWYKNAVVYCLDVPTFRDSNGDGIGDFAGLTDSLPYLAGIGVTCIWLLPFYRSPFRDDGYDVEDYYSVQSDFGTLGDFVEFLRGAAELGMRVIVDLVVNHTSETHPWFQSASQGEGAPYHDWYVWSRRRPPDPQAGVVFPGDQRSTWTYSRKARAYYFHRFYQFQPDLDVENPAVRDEIERIMGFWLQLGVSGFRIDAVPFLISDKGPKARPGQEHYEYLSDFRQFLSWREGDAIMLAEANVPPDKVLSFFGSGDRMQLAFNFWANQHLFLALATEAAAPLVNAYRDLPKLPATAQWANFLRNHDELDLGRLSPEDRATCFAAFGPDPSMQLYDRGLRRRLAPMLQDDRRRIELANSLLFSLPGTPVLFYGEEIGMGEDLALPERNSIRTPMQWSSETNGGFSTAPAERLVRPVIAEGEHRYQRVNVSTQRLQVDSLLNWMERVIRTRKECPEIGWGEMQLLRAEHPSVMAHLYSWRGQKLVAIHNFSRAACTTRVKLPEGVGPLQHIFGRSARPPLEGAEPVVDLEGYGYQWYRARV